MENVLASAAKSNKSYVQGHEADIKDVSTRVLRILARAWKDKMLTDEPFILAAGELYPSEAVKLDKSKILGFVTRYGTINSHTAVLARTKGIPSVIGLGESLKKEYEGKTIIIDGFEGKVYIEPDYTTISKMKQRQDENHTQVQSLERLKGKENITQSGQKLMCARISEAGKTLKAFCAVMRVESDYSEVNLFIWKMVRNFRQKNSSFRYIVWQQKRWE